jgi:hypothetical protein
MDLRCQTLVEHCTSGDQEMLGSAAGNFVVLAPGACTTTFGCTCCSCTCAVTAAGP